MSTKIIHQSIYQIQLRHFSATERHVRAAIHEAGHCVMGMALAYPIDEVLIRADGSGMCKTLAGHRQMPASTSALYSVAGMAAERGFSRVPLSESGWRGDMIQLRETYPDVTVEDIEAMIVEADGILRQWTPAMDAIAGALLEEGTLGHDRLREVVRGAERGYLLADRWRTYPMYEDIPLPAATPSFNTADAIRMLEDIKRKRDRGETLPAKLASIVRSLEAITAAKSAGTTIPALRYGDAVQIPPAASQGYSHRTRPHYETRVAQEVA